MSIIYKDLESEYSWISPDTEYKNLVFGDKKQYINRENLQKIIAESELYNPIKGCDSKSYEEEIKKLQLEIKVLSVSAKYENDHFNEIDLRKIKIGELESKIQENNRKLEESKKLADELLIDMGLFEDETFNVSSDDAYEAAIILKLLYDNIGEKCAELGIPIEIRNSIEVATINAVDETFKDALVEVFNSEKDVKNQILNFFDYLIDREIYAAKFDSDKIATAQSGMKDVQYDYDYRSHWFFEVDGYGNGEIDVIDFVWMCLGKENGSELIESIMNEKPENIRGLTFVLCNGLLINDNLFIENGKFKGLDRFKEELALALSNVHEPSYKKFEKFPDVTVDDLIKENNREAFLNDINDMADEYKFAIDGGDVYDSYTFYSNIYDCFHDMEKYLENTSVNNVDMDNINASTVDDLVERMGNGEDVLGEGQVEENTNNKQMGFAKPWVLGLITLVLVGATVLLMYIITR